MPKTELLDDMSEHLNSSKPQRIEYIDYAKGVAIFLAVWSHSHAVIPWHIHIGTLANILFFYMSGIFFKPTSLKEFFLKKPRQILIPLLTFYLLAIPFCIITDYWDYRDFGHFDWTRLFDIFTYSERADYLSLNLPLWFLMTLFMIQLISIALFRIPKPLILTLSIIALLSKHYLFEWPTLFMVNHAMYWWAYFALGYLSGKYLTKTLLTDNRFRILMLAGSLILILVGEILTINIWYETLPYFIFHIEHFGFIGLTLSALSYTDKMKWMLPINFMGKHSLEILGLHWSVIIPISRLWLKITNNQIVTPIEGAIISILTILLISPMISLINNKCPVIIGKTKTLPKRKILTT